MRRSAEVTIHPEALQHNLKQAKKAAPGSKVLAVIKANAYGHGAVATAGILYPYADGFAVSCISEAVELRQASIERPITVLQGHQNDVDLRLAAHHRLRLVVHDHKQLTLLDNFSGIPATPFDISIKLDTGMHRLGFAPRLSPQLFDKLSKHPLVNAANLQYMTHLSCADDLENDYSLQQIRQFKQATDAFNTHTSIANSAGILGWPKSHADWIRPGIMLYGSSPFINAHLDNSAHSAKKHNLRASMTFSAPLIAIHSLKKGDAIGYGASWRCPKDMKVGVLACGYADGYPRHAATGTPVWLNGMEVPLLGRVSMDMIVIDLGLLDEKPKNLDSKQSAQLGDRVELWGENLSIDRIAHHAETISYELLCNAGNLCSN